MAGAERHFNEGLKYLDEPGFRRFPGGAAVAAIGVAAYNAWMLGRAEVARERMARMVAGVGANNPYDLVYAWQFAAGLRGYLGEYEQAETLAAKALELSEKHQVPYPAALCRCVLGRTRAQLGRTTEGIALIRQGIASVLESGSRVAISNSMASLAAAQMLAGAIVDALETIERALQLNPVELTPRPEILRLRGELRLKLGNPDLASADFRESIALARTIGAKAWELRVTMSLARLLASQGRRDEARTMLADIYGWFTEGFDTADLKDAKALLEELAA